MAWLQNDRDRIRKYLCYPLTEYSLAQIQNRMSAVNALSTEAVNQAQAYLRELADVETQINSKRDYAGTSSYSTSGSSTDYFQGETLRTLRSEGARIIRELADLLQLQVMRDFFAVRSSGSKVVRG